MFDALIREAAERFHLGDKARPFVGLLAGVIFNGSGGFAGLRERFSHQGMEALFDGWVGGHAGDNVLQPDQFASVVGDEPVSSLASRLGIPKSAVTVAGATVLPKLISLLTRDGHLPAQMPAEAAALLVPPARAAAQPHVHSARPHEPARSGGWLKWLIPLALILLALALLRTCRNEPAPPALPPPADPAPVTAPPAAPVARANPRLALEQQADGKVTVAGQLPSEADKARLHQALVAHFGQGNVQGDISVDPATGPAGWLDRLIAALPELKAPGLKLGFDGDRLRIDTRGLDQEQRFALSQRLRTQFGGYEIQGLWDRAAAALAGLKAGFSGTDLVSALNLMNIHFDTGSASITRDSQETLASAAEAIKQAPSGTRIEVGGHTDNTGDAAANQALSQQRADAVVARLGELGVAAGVLSAKGHGQDKPRADNGTEEGRAQNRRIEFSVQR